MKIEVFNALRSLPCDAKNDLYINVQWIRDGKIPVLVGFTYCRGVLAGLYMAGVISGYDEVILGDYFSRLCNYPWPNRKYF